MQQLDKDIVDSIDHIFAAEHIDYNTVRSSLRSAVTAPFGTTTSKIDCSFENLIKMK